jgi:hypothetical protein
MTKDNQVGQSFEASHSIRLPVSLSLPKRSMPLHAGVSDWEELLPSLMQQNKVGIGGGSLLK